MLRFGGIEGGGTTWRAALALGSPENIVEMKTFPTTTPEETMKAVADWLVQLSPFDSIGIATFGPVDCHKESPTYGYITNTPKPNWSNTNVLGYFKEIFPGVPMNFDTDVNAPAFAEFSVNNPRQTSSCMYVTVGTGVGVGLVVNNEPVHGLVHPEGGHLLIRRHESDSQSKSPFEGLCPFHADCVEGLCSSGALAARAGVTASDLPKLADDHEVWDLFAHTMGGLCASAILLVSPERIVLSGGVMKRRSLFAKVRNATLEYLNDYVNHPRIIDKKLENLIVPSPWGDSAGIIGSIFLGYKVFMDLLEKSKKKWKRILKMSAAVGAVALIAFAINFRRRAVH